MKIKVQTVPVSGETSTTEVEVEATVSVEDVLKAAGVDASKMKITVAGKMASSDDRVSEGDTVTVTEKPKGS